MSRWIDEQYGTLTFSAGLLLRRPVRQSCLALGLEYREEKGWLDSVFVVTGPKEKLFRLKRWLQEVSAK